MACESSGARRAAFKCRLVEGICLNSQERFGKALAVLQALRHDLRSSGEKELLGTTLVNLINILYVLKRRSEARELQREALELLTTTRLPIATAHLKAVVGEFLRDETRLSEAAAAYRHSIADYGRIGMSAQVAYVRVILAETLLALGRTEEAEREILAALPTIERESMVREGLAAVALLKESVRRRKADPEALRRLREHLQRNKP